VVSAPSTGSASALQLQGQFAKDLWTPATKDWIKGLKMVIQLAKK